MLAEIVARGHLDDHLVMQEVDQPVTGPPELPEGQLCAVSSEALK